MSSMDFADLSSNTEFSPVMTDMYRSETCKKTRPTYVSARAEP